MILINKPLNLCSLILASAIFGFLPAFATSETLSEKQQLQAMADNIIAIMHITRTAWAEEISSLVLFRDADKALKTWLAEACGETKAAGSDLDQRYQRVRAMVQTAHASLLATNRALEEVDRTLQRIEDLVINRRLKAKNIIISANRTAENVRQQMLAASKLSAQTKPLLTAACQILTRLGHNIRISFTTPDGSSVQAVLTQRPRTAEAQPPATAALVAADTVVATGEGAQPAPVVEAPTAS